jgi:hypothetical protein
MRVRRRSARGRRRAARPWAEETQTQAASLWLPPPATATATASAVRDQARRTAARRSARSRPRSQRASSFASTSFWNQRVPSNTSLDPSSGILVAALVAEVQREQAAAIGPWIGVGSGSTPVYRVPRGQPRVRVRLQNTALHGGRALERAFASVPLPRDAKPAPGTDRHLTVWQPSTDRLWEFFGARHAANGWHAQWGGAMRRVSKKPRVLHPRRVAGRHAKLGGDGKQPPRHRWHDDAG